MFEVSLREKSFVFTRTGITSPAFFSKKTPVFAAFGKGFRPEMTTDQ